MGPVFSSLFLPGLDWLAIPMIVVLVPLSLLVNPVITTAPLSGAMASVIRCGGCMRLHLSLGPDLDALYLKMLVCNNIISCSTSWQLGLLLKEHRPSGTGCS